MQTTVVDPRLAAGRGQEFSAAARRHKQDELAELAALDGEDYRLPREQRIEEGIDWSQTLRVTSLDPIPAHNAGYRLLVRLGWVGGGLGRDGCGRAEPIPLGDAEDNVLRLGLGRAEADAGWATHNSRRAMEAEIQADEDEQRTRQREAAVERTNKIKEDVGAALQHFFCELCCKQYASAMQLDEHLSSYDHHHRKRLAETQAMLSARGKKERDRRRRKEADREMAALAAQSRAAAMAAGLPELAQGPPPISGLAPSLGTHAIAPPLPQDDEPPLGPGALLPPQGDWQPATAASPGAAPRPSDGGGWATGPAPLPPAAPPPMAGPPPTAPMPALKLFSGTGAMGKRAGIKSKPCVFGTDSDSDGG